MKIFKLSTFALLLLAVATASCDDNKNKGGEPVSSTVKQVFNDCYALVTDGASGNLSVYENVSATLSIDMTNSVTGVEFKGFVLGGAGNSMTLNGLQLKSANGWATLEYPSSAVPPVDDFYLRWYTPTGIIDVDNPVNTSSPVAFGFTAGDGTVINGARYPFYFMGTSVTSSSAMPMPDFTSPITGFIVTPDFDTANGGQNPTATILIDGAQFISFMPAIQFVFNRVPLTPVDGGVYFTFEIPEIIPTSGGAPYPNYRCTDLKGIVGPTSPLSMDFVCNVQNNAFPNPVPFNVSVTADPVLN